MPKKYRRHQPIEVEAIQYNRFNDYLKICEWINSHGSPECSNMAEDIVEYRQPLILINNMDGTMGAMLGDYIVRKSNGQYYPYKPDIFEATYKEY